MQICVIDYKMGNIGSVSNALNEIGCNFVISNKPEDIIKSDKLILPGVGAFGRAMGNLTKLGLISVLENEVITNKKPILGICLGMQLFAKRGFENGDFCGLGWIDGEVKRIFPNDVSLKVPHVGWNDVSINKQSRILNGIHDKSPFYFVHSYYFDTNDQNITLKFNYGGDFTAAVEKNNIFGVQFHPEKSAEIGLQLLRNFVGL